MNEILDQPKPTNESLRCSLRERKYRAIEKARNVKCSVEPVQAGEYLVVTPEKHSYTVRFEYRDGEREATCTCKAGYTEIGGIQYRNPCYHACHAATLDSWLTGYPYPDAILFVELARRFKGERFWTDDEFRTLRRRVYAPFAYWQEIQEQRKAVA